MDSQKKIQTMSTDIIHNIMKCMDISELKNISKTCKNLNKDSKDFSQKVKKTNLQNLINSHTCRFCRDASYSFEKGICTDCYLHMCDNCHTIRNNMNEFLKVPVDENDLCYGYMKICHDYCVFRCYNCKMFDDRHQLFLNDEVNFKTVCIDCFLLLEDEEKQLYQTPKCNPNDDVEFDYDY